MIDSRTSKIYRGIAILMVIASHFAGWMYAEPLRPAAKAFVSTLGVYGVDIFFLLSGYGLVKSSSKSGINGIFVLKRFMNSYIPYILIAGFFAIIDKSIDSPRAALNLIIGYDYWFMAVLFAMYIMFMIIYKLGKFKELLITIAVVFFTWWLYNIGQADFWELSNGAFLIGIYAATLDNKFGEKAGEFLNKINLTAIGLAVTLLGLYLFSGSGKMWMHMLTSMAFTVMVLGMCSQRRLNGIFLPTLGRFSLYIYLLHTRFFWKFVAYKEQWSYAKGSIIAAIIILVIGVSIGFAIDWNLNQIVRRIEKKSLSKK